ncbi:MAG: hypothetical protein Q7T14_14260, partial [Aestuariivirga sp.]|nr:hypothetical protein [Aestuariivirga sp.]
AGCLQDQSLMEEIMFKKIILATVLLAIVSPNAFAEDQPKVPKKKVVRVETIKTAIDGAQKDFEPDLKSLDFDVQGASADYLVIPPK